MACLLSACGLIGAPGSGTIITQNREVSGFSKIEFSVPGKLILTQDGTEALTIEGDDNLMEYILTDVEGGTLHIYVNPSVPYLVPTQTIVFRLNVKDIEALTINGSGTAESNKIDGKQLALTIRGSGAIDIDQTTMTGDLSLKVDGSGKLELGQATAKNAGITINGSGNIQASIQAGAVKSRITGSGQVRLDGKTASLDAAIGGSGNVRAQELEAANVTTRIDGSGLMQVWATESLDATINGSGAVRYRGQPKVRQNINGSGSVKSID
jgi:hypothetical protein